MLTNADIRRINKKMREADESHLWPIENKFNATDRAIRRVSKQMKNGLVIDDPSSYEAAIDAEISNIVNDERNW
jgi:hypothetical protein